MGLDSMLYSVPKFGDCTPLQIYTGCHYLAFLVNGQDPDDFYRYTNLNTSDLPPGDVMTKLASYGFTGDPYKHSAAMKEIAYWRGDWDIHRFFVSQTQHGEDDCRPHDPVSFDQIKALRALLVEELDRKELREGNVIHALDLNGDPIQLSAVVAGDCWEGTVEIPVGSNIWFGQDYYDADEVERLRNSVAKLGDVQNQWDDDRLVFYLSSW